MTRVLFVPDDQSVIILDSSLPAEELTTEVNTGSWEPPPPCQSLIPGLHGETTTPDPPDDRTLYAMQLDSLVVITTVSRQALAPNEPSWVRRGKALNGNQSSAYLNNVTENDGGPILSQRLTQVLRGLAVGLNTKQIALRLGVTVRTVRFHIRELKGRFGAGTHAELVGRAAVLGLLEERWFQNREP